MEQLRRVRHRNVKQSYILSNTGQETNSPYLNNRYKAVVVAVQGQDVSTPPTTAHATLCAPAWPASPSSATTNPPPAPHPDLLALSYTITLRLERYPSSQLAPTKPPKARAVRMGLQLRWWRCVPVNEARHPVTAVAGPSHTALPSQAVEHPITCLHD